MKRYSKKGWENRKKDREGYAEFYEQQCEMAKHRPCMECGAKLRGHVSEIAHLLPKSRYKSIATDDNAVLYLCGLHSTNQCHSIYDSTFEKRKSMNCFNIAIDKYIKLYRKIKEKGREAYLFEDYLRGLDIWLPIKSYEGLYDVSTNGDIRSHHGKKTRVIKSHPDKDGYLHIELNKQGERKDLRVHRIVAETFVPNPNNKKYVNHLNFIKDDNFYLNLEWCTSRENSHHYHKTNEKKTSQYIGVRLHSGNRWQARITIDNKNYHLGLFDSEFLANLAYQKAKKDYYLKGKLPSNDENTRSSKTIK